MNALLASERIIRHHDSLVVVITRFSSIQNGIAPVDICIIVKRLENHHIKSIINICNYNLFFNMEFACQILLARRRYLQQSWHCRVPERDYWRLWWNDRAGASVAIADQSIVLDPQHVFLVAPNTSFTSTLECRLQHFWLHFQLGKPFDLAAPGIYPRPVTDRLKEDLQAAVVALGQDDRHRLLVLTRLVNDACLALPDGVWQEPPADPRLVRVLDAMVANLGQPLPNETLAVMAGMAPTAFARWFRKRIGVPPQTYYLQERLKHACHLLEHEDISIDEVAAACGFCDRNYFSTVFRNKLRITPAAFRNAHDEE